MSKHGGDAFSSEVSYGSVISTEAVAQLGKNGKPYAVSKGRSAASTPLYFRVR